MRFKIKIANKNNIKDIVNLDRIAHKEFSWWITKDSKFFRKFLGNRNNQILIAEKDGRIIGYLGLEYNKDRKSTWLNEIYVVKKERENYVAKKLVKEALKNWKKKSKSIVLLTADRNLAIFEKLGFQKTMNFMELVRRKKR